MMLSDWFDKKPAQMTLFLRQMALGWVLMVKHESGNLEVLAYVQDPDLKNVR